MRFDNFGNLLFSAAALLLPTVVDAQVALGSGCGALTQLNGQQQSVVLGKAASAGQWIIVSVTVNNTFAQFDATNPVTDSAGNHYATYGTTGLAGGTGFIATFAGRATNVVNAGASIIVNYTTSGSLSAQSCVAASSFSGVLALSDPGDVVSTAAGAGSDWYIEADAPGQHANDLVYVVFASADGSGNISPLYPAQPLGQICSTDAPLCMLPAWNFGYRTPGNYESAEALSDSSARWGASVVTFQSNDRIFGDGFE